MINLQYLTDQERLALTPAVDEYIFTKDTRMLYYGDGETPGGKSVIKDEIVGLFTNTNNIKFNYNRDLQKLEVSYDATLIVNDLKKSINDVNKSINDVSKSINNVSTRLSDSNSFTNSTLVDIQHCLTSLITSINIAIDSISIGQINAPVNNITAYTNNLNIDAGGINGNRQNAIAININASRGTVSTPKDIQLGDELGALKFNTYVNEEYTTHALIDSLISQTILDSEPLPSTIRICVKGNNRNPLSGGWHQYLFQPDGVFNAQVIQTGSYNGFINYPSTAVAGMIIFDSSANRFFGYNGSEWKQLDN